MIRDYSIQIAEFWPTIMRAWNEHSDKRPIIECDLANRTVAAYPAREYIEKLSDRTREDTLQDFERVMSKGGIMVFIRDIENRVLQSHTFVSEDIGD